MNELLELFKNPRYWMALLYLTLPLVFGFLGGVYIIAKERIQAWTKKEKNI